MKFQLLTAHSEEYKELASLTEPGKKSYAKMHGYKFKSLTHSGWDLVAWERVHMWLNILREGCFDWLFFTGSDVLITNPYIELDSFVSPGVDFIFACDGCGLQSDSWLMRNCRENIEFLEKVQSLAGKVPNEQDAMQLVLANEFSLPNFLHGLPCKRKDGGAPASQELLDCLVKSLNRSPVICKIVPQSALNAYPLAHYGGTGKEPWGWHYGDFILHIPGKPLKERIACIKELNFLPLPF